MRDKVTYKCLTMWNKSVSEWVSGLFSSSHAETTHFIKTIKHLLQTLASFNRQLYHSLPTVVQRRHFSVLELRLHDRFTILMSSAISIDTLYLTNFTDKALFQDHKLTTVLTATWRKNCSPDACFSLLFILHYLHLCTNEVILHQAQLILGWVTIFGWA